MKVLIEKIKALEMKKKIAFIIAAVFGFLICGFVSGVLCSVVSFEFEFKLGHLLYLGLLHFPGIVITLILFIIILIFVYTASNKAGIFNEIGYQDEDTGANYMENGTLGSMRWMTTDEIRAAEDVFTVDKPENIVETIYGIMPDGSGDVVAYSNSPHVRGNKNHLILGSSGTGKSYCFVRTELMQSIKRGESIVVTDPKGELYRDLAAFLEQNDYTVKKLNLAGGNVKYSDTWNCVAEVIDPDTERLNSGRLQSFVETYITNMAGVGEKADFWIEGGKNLMQAYIGAAAWEREIWIVNAVKKYVDTIYEDEEKDSIVYLDMNEKLNNKMISLPDAFRILIETAHNHHIGSLDIANMIEEIKNNAPEFSIGKILNDMIYHPNKIETLVCEMPASHPARMAYEIFSSKADGVTDQVRGSTRQTIKIKLQLFASPELRRVLSNDDIVISDINKKKTAFFLIISDKDTVYRCISSLFFSFLFNDAENTYDKALGENFESFKPLPVTIMMDETYSVGIIPQFATFMSTCRSRKLNVYIVLQNIRQLSDLYGEFKPDTIISNCSTIYFLGCNDEATAKFMSEFVLGEGTIASQSRHEGGWGSQFGVDTVSISESKRYLRTAAEMRKIKDKVVVSRQGELPLKLNVFPYTEHKFYKNGLLTSKSALSGIPIMERAGIRDAIDDECRELNSKVNVYIRINRDTFKEGVRVISVNRDEFFISYTELKNYAINRLVAISDPYVGYPVVVYRQKEILITKDGVIGYPKGSKEKDRSLTVRHCKETALKNTPDIQMSFQQIVQEEDMSLARDEEDKINTLIIALEEKIAEMRSRISKDDDIQETRSEDGDILKEYHEDSPDDDEGEELREIFPEDEPENTSEMPDDIITDDDGDALKPNAPIDAEFTEVKKEKGGPARKKQRGGSYKSHANPHAFD